MPLSSSTDSRSAASGSPLQEAGTAGLTAQIPFDIDDSIRGVPAGTEPFSADKLPGLAWSVTAGDVSYPILTVSEPDYAHNRDAIFAFARSHGVLLAPHAKTPMSTAIASDLLRSGAWGLSVANVQQASIFLRSGARRLIVANQIGGERSGTRLGHLLSSFPDAEALVFVDSLPSLETAARAGRVSARPVSILIEVGKGRGGCRSLGEAQAIIDKALENRHVILAGVASYEGAAASNDVEATKIAIAELNALAADVFRRVRVAAPDRHLVLSSGGSQFFDLVVNDLAPVVRDDGNADLVLRSGAIYFHDHGVYDRALQRLDQRNGFTIDGKIASASSLFRPAMRVWGEILSRPEPGLAICGVGMRDVSFDQGFPVPLKLWREGNCLAELSEAGATVDKLNDQHAFLRFEGDLDLRVGDIVEFGISHPCTCFDRWRFFFGIDSRHRVTSIHQTFFG